MIWLTWRQSRLEALIGGAVLALVALFLLWTGLEMSSTYRDLGLPSCETLAVTDEACQLAANSFRDDFRTLEELSGWLNLLPFLLGLLLAAPTLLDFEQGTYRLAWMQSVTRRRWLAAKIGCGLAVAVGTSAALTALWTWWRGPFDAIEGRFGGNSFDFEGTVPVAYVVFAFALCLALGTLLRRATPSIGIALVLFMVARIGVMDQLRPHYLAPLKLTWDPTGPAPVAATFSDGSWVVGRDLVAAPGSSQTVDDALRACRDAAISGTGEEQMRIPVGDIGAVGSCLHDNGILNSIVYHPADRFWIFQGIETALFLGVAAGLLGLTFWWVTRRIV